MQIACIRRTRFELYLTEKTEDEERESWMKKEGNVLFDVAMGSYDGAECASLVGMFALSQVPKRYKNAT